MNSRRIFVIIIVMIIAGFVNNLNVLADDNREIITGTAYTLPVEDVLIKARLYRGHSHDRQHLGIYMPAGSSFSIRAKDNKSFKLDIFNNDRETERDGNEAYTIGNDWVTITASVDSVPFLRTNNVDYESLSYEIKDKNGVEDITVFEKGGNETEFFNKWSNNSQNYAVIIADRVTFLVPREDKDRIIGHGTYSFTSIDDMLNWYDSVINSYDEYVGLSKNAVNNYDYNFDNKFFIKTDIHGPGSACFRAYGYISKTGTSLSSFLEKSWTPLHEIGHAYQHGYTNSDNSLNISEVGNNFFAYYEEQKYLNADDGGFMWERHTQEEMMSVIEGVSEFNNLVDDEGENKEYHFYERLFAFTNLFDKIGMKDAMAKASSEYRRIRNEDNDIANADLFAIYFSQGTGYNVIPYFNSVKIFPSLAAEEETYSKKYPMVYPLAYLVSRNTATTIASNLNLRGIYSVVENNDIKNYINSNNISRNVKFNITTDNVNNLRNKKIYIKNSSNNIVKEQTITGSEVLVEDVPIGIYYVDISNGIVDNLNYLVVTENSSVLSSNVNYISNGDNDSGDLDNNSENGNNQDNGNNNASNNDNTSNNNNTAGNNNTSANLSNDTNVSDNKTDDIVINVEYEYDPKNVNDLGEVVSVPNTKMSNNNIFLVFGTFLTLGTSILVVYIIKKKYI